MIQKFFQALETKLKKNTNLRVIVPLADNEAVARSLQKAKEKGFIEGATLIGNYSEIKNIFGNLLNQSCFSVIEASSENDALQKTITEIKTNKAHVIMKGMCQSASLIKAVLDKQNGLEHGFLSHLTFFQLPDKESFGILTDSAVNISPDEDSMHKIIENAYNIYQKLNNKIPKIALLSANEKVSDKMQSTKLAESVTKKYIDREDIIVEGPVAFDLAVSSKSAQIKKYKGKLNGDADIFVAPRIETANALYKSLQHYIKASMGGILFGAQCPIIHPSRADNAQTKYNSLLLGLSTLE